MIKLAVGVIAVLATTIIAISIFLAPDTLMDCGESPSDVRGCERADAVVAVSGGDTSARTQRAIDLYQNGWTDLLIFSGAASDKSGPSNAEVMQQQALAQGVPASDIRTEQTSENTRENALNTRKIFEENNVSDVILVSSAYHQKRVMLEFRDDAPNVSFRSHPVRADNQWSVWWWTSPYGWYLALSEIVKIIVFYIGKVSG
jgi:uncharacterized SAM-binding protein YcdF (DUF218 family)